MRRVSVLVVDDSVVVRRLVTNVLAEDPEIEVAGTASTGRLALTKIPQLNPDIVTLDIEMPDLDGLATLRELRRLYPRLPVVMFSTLTERGAAATLDALSLGANDYVTKPANVGSVRESMDSVRDQLVPKLKALAGLPPAPARTIGTRPAAPGAAAPGAVTPAGFAPGPGPAASTPPRSRRTPRRDGAVELLAIGASTGGPDALTRLLAELPADIGVPIVVVQHMPPVFTRLFAQRLDQRVALTVREATDGDALRPGEVLIAPGDFHLTVRRDGGQMRAVVHQGTPENFCRPAVDVLFRSVAEQVGGRALAVVLTGMGTDGMRGGDRLVAAGGEVLAQDRATSVVWGMPGAVASAGLASEVLPLAGIAPAVLARLSRSPVGSARR